MQSADYGMSGNIYGRKESHSTSVSMAYYVGWEQGRKKDRF
jgi:hypothetical protein